MIIVRSLFIIAGTFIFSFTFAQNENSEIIYAQEEPEENTQVQPQQPQQKSQLSEKIFFGGGFGAGFGSYTFISISPIIGYRITPKLSAGLRLMYQYTTYDYPDHQTGQMEKYQGNDFGVGGFARFMVYGPLYLQAEYEHLNYDGLYWDGTSSRDSFNSFMAGGGISARSSLRGKHLE